MGFMKKFKKKVAKRGRGITQLRKGFIPKDPRKTGIGGFIIGALLMLLLLYGLGLFGSQNPFYIYGGTPGILQPGDTELEGVKYYQMIVTIDWEEDLLLAEGAILAYVPPEDPAFWILVGTQEGYVPDEFIEDFQVLPGGVGRSLYDFPDNTTFAVLGFEEVADSYFDGFVVPGVNSVFTIIVGGWPSFSTVYITWVEDGSGTDWTGQTEEWHW